MHCWFACSILDSVREELDSTECYLWRIHLLSVRACETPYCSDVWYWEPTCEHENVHDNGKLNASCGLVHDRVVSPCFLYGKTFKWNVYIPIFVLEELHPFVTFQHESTPHTAVTMCVDVAWWNISWHMGKSWWSSLLATRFLDITPVDLFLWDMWRIMFTDYLRMTLQTRGRIIDLVGSVQKGILTRMWAELVCQLYVVSTTTSSQVDMG